MPDPSTPTPGTPAPTPAPTPAHKPPSPIDQKLAVDLKNDKEVIDATIDLLGSDAALAAALATHFLDAAQTVAITPASLQALSQEATDAQQAGADIVNKSAQAHDTTAHETTDAAAARAAIRKIQSAAKEKYEETNPTRLDAYYVGQPVHSRAQLEQAATACWGLIGNTDSSGSTITPQDTLPGIGTTQLSEIKTGLGAYVTAQTTQSGAQKEASDARTAYKTKCEQIARRRRRLQRAIDTERPFGPANATLRRRLGLPVDKGIS